MSKKQGYIKTHRSIQECWIWNCEKYDKAHAWLDLLLDANHHDVKMLIDGHPTIVERGCLYTSKLNLANKWRWDRKTVTSFLNLLESDGMITQERFQHGTMVTIVNYGRYQQSTDNETDTKTDNGADNGADNVLDIGTDINNNDKNVKNDKKGEKNAPAREESFVPLNSNDVAFEKFYESHFGTKYLWQEDTSEAVERIAQCIADKMAEQGGEVVNMTDQLTVFLEAVYRLGDNWLNQRFTPQLIAKQFNQLYQRIKNGNKTNDNPTGVSADYLARITSELLA